MKFVNLSLLSLCMVASSPLIITTVSAENMITTAPTVRVVNSDAYQMPANENHSVPYAQPVTVELNKQAMPKESVYFHVARDNEDNKVLTAADEAKQPTYPVRRMEDVPMEELTVVSPNTPLMPANAFKVRSDIPVKYIDSSTQGTRLTGNIRGLGVDIYHFNAQQGQTVRIIHDKSHPAIEAAIFRPSMGIKFGSVHVLPETGDYELRIVQTRQDAARNKTPRHYDITFQVQ